jgi:polyisoprenoid-binding protein YceI
MKKAILTFVSLLILTVSGLVAQTTEKLVSKNGQINFYSHTDIEDISADNFTVVSTLNLNTGETVFSVSMQGFEFEKSLMQKHYNSPKFLDTKKFPKSKFKGRITNLEDIDFSKNGTYKAEVSGELSLHGITKDMIESGTILVQDGTIVIDATMQIVLADFDVTFVKGKPSKNIAKTIDISIKSEFIK